MKFIFVFSLILISHSLIAEEILCDVNSGLKARLKYETSGGLLTVMKGKEKVVQCQVKFGEENLRQEKNVNRGADIRDFKLNDCVVYNDSLIGEIKISTGGFLKIHSPNESYLKFADNFNTSRCKMSK